MKSYLPFQILTLLALLMLAIPSKAEETSTKRFAASTRELGIDRAIEAVTAMLLIENPALEALHISDTTRSYDLLESETLCGVRVVSDAGFPCIAGSQIEREDVGRGLRKGVYREICITLRPDKANQREFHIGVYRPHADSEYELMSFRSNLDVRELSNGEESVSVHPRPYPLDSPGVLEACRATIVMQAWGGKTKGSIYLDAGFREEDFTELANRLGVVLGQVEDSRKEYPLLRSCKSARPQILGDTTYSVVDVAWQSNSSTIKHYFVVIGWRPDGRKSVEYVPIGTVEERDGVELR